MPSISIPTAIMIAGGVGAVGGVASGMIGSNAAKDAGQVQADAANAAANNQMGMFNQVRESLHPYMNLGQNGMTGLGELLPNNISQNGAFNPLTAIKDPQAWLEATPGYKFVRDQGLKATQNSYAAKGLGVSGAAVKGAGEFATGLADTTYSGRLGDYERRIQDYMSMIGLGQNAAAGVGNVGMNAATQAGQFQTSGAAALGAGQVGSANSMINGMNSFTGAAGNSAMMAALSSTGMFGGNNNTSNAFNSFSPPASFNMGQPGSWSPYGYAY